MNLNFVLRVAALILLILATIFAFGVGDFSLATVLGISFAGLACWVGSTLAPVNVP
jgi:hypothetical protein